jgi:hypothetical protein
LIALRELVEASGLHHPEEIQAWHMVRRVDDGQVRLLSRYYPFLKPRELLDGEVIVPVFATYWPMARAESFHALA